MDNWKRMFRALWARRQKKASHKSSEDFVRLGLTRLEDRVVLDAAGVVVDLKPGLGSSSPASLTNFNGGVYFSASGTDSTGHNVGRELYRLDSQGHVSLVADINPGSNDSNPTNFLVAGDTLFFSAIGANGRELYQVNSNNVVSLVADINPGTASSNPIPGIDYQGQLYFSAVGSSGNELYAYNRTTGAVSLAADLVPGSGSSTPSGFVAFGGNAYFYSTGSNSALYRINPIGAVSLVTSTPFEPRQLTPFNDTLYFTGLVSSNNRQLYALTLSPGNVETITQVGLPNGATNGTSPTDLTVIGDNLYFSALMQGRGRELYRIDSAGHIANFDLSPGSGGSSPIEFTSFNGDVYFLATVSGQPSLYRLNGASTTLAPIAVALPTGVTLQSSSTLTAQPEGLYFDASSAATGRELYRLNPDGSIELTADINPGSADADPASVTSLGGVNYLAATDVTVGRELFRLVRSPSAIDIVGGQLVFQDLAGDRDNRLVISSDGINLHVVDLNGPAIASTIAGISGNNSNDVTIPLASLVGVSTLNIQTRGGNDSVTFDLSTHAVALLGQFSGWTLDGGSDAGPPAGDRLRFLGDGVQTLRYTPDSATSNQGQVSLTEASLTSNIQFVGIEGIDVGGMSSASFVVPAAANPTDSLLVAAGFDQLDGTQAALVVTGAVGGTNVAPVAFFQNQTLIVDTATSAGGTDLIRLTGATNNHGNTNLTVRTGAASIGTDEIRVTGAIALDGALSLDSGDLQIQSDVQLGTSADLTARRDITLTNLGRITAHGDVILRADSDASQGGDISIGATSGIDADAGQITLTATDDVTIGSLVTTNATTGAVWIQSSAGQVLSNSSAGPDILAESNGAVTTILAQHGVGTATSALDLSVRNLVVATQDSDQFLAERNDLSSIDLNAGSGAIQLTAAGSIQDADGSVDVVAHDLLLKAQAAGLALSPLQTQLSHLEASVQDGGLFLRNTGDLTIGGAAPTLAGVSGLQSTGSDLDVATVGQLTVIEPVTTLSGGSVRLAATGDVTVNDLVSTVHGDVTITGDSDLAGGGGLTIGSTGGVDAGDGRVTLTATDNVTLGGVLTNNATVDAVRVTSLAGKVLSRASGSGPDISAEANGAVTTILAPQGVGTAASALNLSVSNLVVVTQDSNQFLAEQNDLASIDLNAGSGAIQLTAAGSIQDADNSVDVVAHDLLLKVQGAGSALSPLQTQLSHLEASVQDGGLFLRNTGDLTLGGAFPVLAGVSGLQSTGGDLDVATIGQLTVLEPVANLAGGSVRLAATGDVTVNQLVSTLHGDVTITGDSDLTGGGGLTIGSTGGVDAGDGRVTLTATDNVTIGGVLTNNATVDAVRVTSLAGKVLSRASGSGADISAEANGAVTTILAPQGVGTATSALNLSVSNLVVVTQDSDQFLAEQNDLASIDLNAGSGAIQLAAAGSIQDADGSVDVVAHELQLKAAGAGFSVAPLQTQIDHLEATVQSGGLFLDNSTDLTIGGTSQPMAGVQGLQTAGGAVEIHAAGQIDIAATATATGAGSLRLRADTDIDIHANVSSQSGTIRLEANRDIHAAAGTLVSSTAGDIFLIADHDDSLGGTIIYLGNMVVGGGTVTFRLTDATGLLSGIVQGGGGLAKDGLGQLTMTAASRNTYTGSTDLLAGILRVDGAIGAGRTAAGPLTIAGGATLMGTGDINAPVWAFDPTAQILAEDGLRMGDGSDNGFRYAGTLIIHSFDVVTLRDADVAELGIQTTIESQARLIAHRGVEIGSHEQLDGDGVVQGNIVGLANSRIIPGHAGSGTLTTAPGNLRLGQDSILVMQINGDQPGTQYSQLNVNGTVVLQGAILDTPGKFVPANGTRITLINNDGTDRVVGNLRDVTGNALLQGSKFSYNGYEARISYRTGPGRNDVVVTLFTLPFTFTSSTSGTSEGHARDAAAAIFMAALHEQRRNSLNNTTLPYPPVMDTVVTPQQEVVIEAQAKTLESRTTSRLRLFIRVVNEGTNVESPTEYPLDPGELRDLLSVFKRYRFPDGKYRVYLQEPDRNPRRILEVNVVDGKIVPANFRESEQRVAPPKVQPTEPAAPPPESSQSSATPPVELPWRAAVHAQLADEAEVAARVADLRRRYLTLGAS